jgi:murein DD-endopeptidase MepM/ murein hydrolase activator NlpD
LRCEKKTPETLGPEELSGQPKSKSLKPVFIGLLTSIFALSSLTLLNEHKAPGTLGVRLPQRNEFLALNQSQDESAAQEAPAITHVVVRGDTLDSVAKRYQTSPYVLIESNRLKSRQLKAGQRLMIPGKVVETETAEEAQSKAQALLEEAKQRLAAKNQESAPVASVPSVSIVEASQEEGVAPSETQEQQGLGPAALLEEAKQRLAKKQASMLGAENQPFSSQDLQLASAKEDTAFRSGQRFIKPVPGVLFSRFGMRGGRLHAGVDIAGPIGTPVVAAKDGVVVTAGIRLSGYGQMVDIQHADNTLTRYAHASRIFVRAGQRVRQGETIMARGCSGHCTGPHVHFEVRIGGTPVNPMRFIR